MSLQKDMDLSPLLAVGFFSPVPFAEYPLLHTVFTQTLDFPYNFLAPI